MKSSLKISGMILVLLLTGSTLTKAQDYGRRERFPAISDLTEQQRTDIKILNLKHRSKMLDFRAEMLKTEDIEKRGDIAKKMQILRDNHRKDIFAQLTDEQKEAFGKNDGWPRMGRGPMNGGGHGICPCDCDRFNNLPRQWDGKGMRRGANRDQI